eukprot:Phypoly_transcript_22584.p1 GENE.Phypoly_transcript_22584~~Phypoly_transcript_22584.p1  ORF type:complete len:136 (+),score=23.95 Phypoly_transcript_22584:138-545(+)
MNFLPGTASLVEEVDKKLMVVLRDGRKLIGILRSFDQFANIVLENTVERIYVGNQYGEQHRGLFLVRGENVVLLGEVDPALAAKEATLEKVDYAVITQKAKEERDHKESHEKTRRRAMIERGLALDNVMSVDDQF